MSYRQQRQLWHIGGYLFLAVVLIIIAFPIYWIILTAIKPASLTYTPKPALWTNEPTLESITKLFSNNPFHLWMFNSLWVTIVNCTIAVAVGTMASYSLSRLRYPGRQFLSGLFFFVYLVPASLLFIPLYVILSNYRLLDNLWGLAWTYLTFTIPFCTWILKAYFAGIPIDLEEAAMVDGATRFQALLRILLPLAAPGIAAAAIFAFTLSWNEFLYAFIFLQDERKFTLSPGLTTLVYGDVFLWGQIMAGAVLMSIPVLFLYFFAQRFVVTGLTAGAVKG
ncbi:MAG: carbohydrate ABC transporter permease [Caldilineaceae bacterium]|nr:carbohydrate ABC transporter permease [Caldilineaceae bacterium]MCB0096237.1 carbohydrate ABC transporter permease [Caldilineaceae bacterium]MCB9151666.1 carbohydrate ABC transporter permease [Caldilineaceae bacterium]